MSSRHSSQTTTKSEGVMLFWPSMVRGRNAELAPIVRGRNAELAPIVGGVVCGRWTDPAV